MPKSLQVGHWLSQLELYETLFKKSLAFNWLAAGSLSVDSGKVVGLAWNAIRLKNANQRFLMLVFSICLAEKPATHKYK